MAKLCEVCKNKISPKNKKFCSSKCDGIWKSINFSGENSPSWKGGGEFRICKFCNKKFKIEKWRKFPRGQFCSFECSGNGNSKKGKNNPNWKGDKAGYWTKHEWIAKIKGRAANYKCAMKNETCSAFMEWSNISRKYKRDLFDWQVLCRSHHKRYDWTPEWSKAISRGHKLKRSRILDTSNPG